MKNNHDLIGSALGFPGAWGPGWAGWGPAPGTVAFGGNEFPTQEQLEQYRAAMTRLGAGAVPPFGPGCGYGAPAMIDPVLAASMIAKQHGVVVGADYGPQETEQMLGADDNIVLEPDEVGTLTFTPELVAKLVRFFLPTKCASQLSVLDITIGIKSQLPGKGKIPGLVFSEVSTNNRINGDTCYIRQPVVARVQNVSQATVTVEAAVGLVAVQGAGPRIIGPGSGHM